MSGRASAAGGYGSGRHQINEGVAGEGLMEAQGNAVTSILNNAYNTGQTNQLRAQQMAPMMAELGFMPSSTQKSTGAEYRADAMNPAMNLQGYAGMVNPYAVTSAGAQPYQPPISTIGAGLAGGMTGFGLGQELKDYWGSPNPQVPAGQKMTASNVGNYYGTPPSEFRNWA
jgi:hypothetical protein